MGGGSEHLASRYSRRVKGSTHRTDPAEGSLVDQ